MKLSKDAFEFIQCINKRKVEYLLVGGWAVSLYGRPRFTGDYDFFIGTKEKNAKRILEAISEFGFGSLDITLPDLTKIGQVIQLGFEPNRIDILTTLSGVDFESAYQRRQEILFDGLNVSLISKEDLIVNKRALGRAKDLADIEALSEIVKSGK